MPMFREVARYYLAEAWEKAVAEGLTGSALRTRLLEMPCEWATPFEIRVWREEVRRVMRDGLTLRTKPSGRPADLPGQKRLF